LKSTSPQRRRRVSAIRTLLEVLQGVAGLGKIRTNKLTTSGLLKPFRAEDYTIFERRPEDIKNIGGFQWDKRNEPAFEPEEFSKLKRGGDGTCQAVILWLAHQFADNANKNFHVLTFEQEPR
jgi:hypothetical protein